MSGGPGVGGMLDLSSTMRGGDELFDERSARSLSPGTELPTAWSDVHDAAAWRVDRTINASSDRTTYLAKTSNGLEKIVRVVRCANRDWRKEDWLRLNGLASSYRLNSNDVAFVREYVPGHDLETYLERLGRTLSVDELARIFAVRGNHSSVPLHRRITPSNVIIGQDAQGNLRYSIVDGGLPDQALDMADPRTAPYLAQGGSINDNVALARIALYALTGRHPPLRSSAERSLKDQLRIVDGLPIPAGYASHLKRMLTGDSGVEVSRGILASNTMWSGGIGALDLATARELTDRLVASVPSERLESELNGLQVLFQQGYGGVKDACQRPLESGFRKRLTDTLKRMHYKKSEGRFGKAELYVRQRLESSAFEGLVIQNGEGDDYFDFFTCPDEDTLEQMASETFGDSRSVYRWSKNLGRVTHAGIGAGVALATGGPVAALAGTVVGLSLAAGFIGYLEGEGFDEEDSYLSGVPILNAHHLIGKAAYDLRGVIKRKTGGFSRGKNLSDAECLRLALTPAPLYSYVDAVETPAQGASDERGEQPRRRSGITVKL